MIGCGEHVLIPLPAAPGQYFTLGMILSLLEAKEGGWISAAAWKFCGRSPDRQLLPHQNTERVTSTQPGCAPHHTGRFFSHSHLMK